jgi:hypothetical protein
MRGAAKASPRPRRAPSFEGARGIDHVEAPRIVACALEVGVAHALEECGRLALELVGRAPLRTLALVGDRRVEVEEERGIGLAPGVHDAFESEHGVARQAAASALVGVGRVAEPSQITQRPAASAGSITRAR